MSKGQSNEISFVVGIAVFLGFVFFLGGLASSEMNENILGQNSLSSPPIPPEAGDILGMAGYIIAMIGYLVTSIFGLSSSYALVTGIVVIPITFGIAWLLLKLIRGTG